MKVWIVIAAYNEENNIERVVKDLIKGGYKNIVVVDDGSKDNTFDIISKLNVISLKHIINRGQGAALKTGIDFALLQGADIIITFDADGQHRTQDIKNLILPIKEKKCDVCLGSRFLKKNKIPFMRKILLRGSVLILYLFYGAKMTDAHNGLRALSKSAARKIKIKSDRMDHASEIIDEIVQKKIIYKEVPVVIKYTKDSLEKGRGSFSQAFKVLFKMIIRKVK